MDIKFFYRKYKNIVIILTILIIMLLIASGILLIIGKSNIYENLTDIAIILTVLQMILLDEKTIKNSKKIIINRPLAIMDKNIFITKQKKSSLIIFFIVTGLTIFIQIKSNLVETYIASEIMLFLQLSFVITAIKVNFYKKNPTLLINDITDKSKFTQISKIEKKENLYKMEELNKDAVIIFSKQFIEYDNLIELVDQIAK